MFIDTAKITVKAGKGGNGVNSFYRDKLTIKGHPDGGDGGHGGDVIIRVSTDVHTLIDFQYRHTFKAADGGHGGSKQKRGRDGAACIIDAPPGTLVYDIEKKNLIADLVKPLDSAVVAEGGEGGRGNRSHKNATAGTEGEVKNLFIELKLIADVGIIGLPNAGKSTLLSNISKAKPKIAAYAFTTKAPVLGVVEYEDLTFRVAEIPGLIEGAHKGRGLGDKFLRHAERTKLFIHLLDIARPDPKDIIADYKILNSEMSLYSKGLSLKPQIIVANKIDLEGARENLNYLRESLNKDIIGISAKEGEGTDVLIERVVEALKVMI